ncbi:universal stress protein [Mycobacterium sp.]|uniref:universal stress protein n=1 Tax=Mycobacterium sp. TaxID=1785 RepID=UPI0031DA8C8D
MVGIDGSKAARHAAVWAVQEAVGREIPLRLLCFIDPADLCGADTEHSQFAAARAALHDAQRAVEATGEPVKIETEVVVGKPLAELVEQARSAAMVCVGSIGIKHVCHGTSSVAAALPGLALCPVAVIRRPAGRSTTPQVGSIVVEVDNAVVLQHAFDEARLRAAPVRAVSARRANVADDIDGISRRAQARLNRRIARWTRLYPDVPVEPIAIRGSVCRYLAADAKSVELFVTGTNGCGNPVGPGPIAFPVLTVRRNNL